jgi:hypothetical protein
LGGRAVQHGHRDEHRKEAIGMKKTHREDKREKGKKDRRDV